MNHPLDMTGTTGTKHRDKRCPAGGSIGAGLWPYRGQSRPCAANRQKSIDSGKAKSVPVVYPEMAAKLQRLLAIRGVRLASTLEEGKGQ
jgi:hypothetical protein